MDGFKIQTCIHNCNEEHNKKIHLFSKEYWKQIHSQTYNNLERLQNNLDKTIFKTELQYF